MKQEESYNEQELREIEEQLRSLGTPYNSPAPDERYWANFRVRLMSRIEADEKSSVFASVVAWFSASAVRTIAIGAAVVIVAVVSMTMFRTSDAPQLASNQTAVTPPPTPGIYKDLVAKSTVPPPAAPKQQPKAVVKPSVKKQAVDDLADAGDIANFDATLSPGSADEPVDYSTLSETELQSVLADVSSMNN